MYSIFFSEGGWSIILDLISGAGGLLTLYANWKLFEKCGVEGWKALIPIYNLYIMYELFWSKKYFFIQLALGFFLVVGMVIFAGVMISLDNYGFFYYHDSFAMMSVIVLVLFSILFILATITLEILLTVKQAACFGQKGAFILGLIFFSLAYTLMLTTNPAYQYQKPEQI